VTFGGKVTSIKKELLQYSSLVSQYLQALEFNEPKINQMYQYAIHGGRRLRPTLVLLSAEVVGGNPHDVVCAAAAIELMHKFTLVHDDIIDKDEFRRNKKTFHAMFGTEYGIIIGDLLISLSFDVLSQLHATHDSDRVLQCYKVLSQNLKSLCMGEIYDCLFEEKNNITWEKYIELVDRKTSSLLEKSLRLGAILGGGSKSEIDILVNYGRDLGIAFQIKNDINNVLDIEEKIGRHKGFDVLQRKKTCLVVKTIEMGRQEDQGILNCFASKQKYSEDSINQIIAMFEKNGAIEFCQAMANEHVNKAKNSLKGVKESQAKEILLQLASYIQSDDYWHGTA